ncbi:PTS sugar transporter subunit IIA [Limosilactobacillus caecicola]|uniref:PTS sugar transporter subunit IIA n=1 Tax=Limosilactobacillus caecicola TaxID=2941332 RepID=UPI00203B7D0B|nr:PTS sugar transporter subunit IIA [Limosilactobacillus caecicola]
MLFDKKVILFDQSASDNTDALTQLANHLHEAGVVNEEYKDAILKREASFPTGLMTQTIGVAIPHCDPDKVIEPQIGFMRLKEPVTFHQMGDNAEIQVKVIFMLALKKSDDQLSMLQKLMALFQNKEAMNAVQTITSVDDFIELMKSNEIIK